jgi:hypothetical protein
VLGAPASIVTKNGPDSRAVPAHNTLQVSSLDPEHLTPSERPDADFHGAVNFAMTEYSEVCQPDFYSPAFRPLAVCQKPLPGALPSVEENPVAQSGKSTGLGQPWAP